MFVNELIKSQRLVINESNSCCYHVVEYKKNKLLIKMLITTKY